MRGRCVRRCAGGLGWGWVGGGVSRRGLSEGSGGAHRCPRCESHQGRPTRHGKDARDGDSAQHQRSPKGHRRSEGRLSLQRPEQRQHVDHALSHVHGAREDAGVHDGRAKQQQYDRTERKRHGRDEQERPEDGVRAAGRGSLVELHPRVLVSPALGTPPLPEQHRHQNEQRCGLRERRRQLQPRNCDQWVVTVERSNQDLVDEAQILDLHSARNFDDAKLEAVGCVRLARWKFDGGRHVCTHS